MNILAMDTTAKSCSVAVLSGDKTLYLKTENNGFTHSELLLPMIEEALASAGLTYPQIDAYAVTEGPGSFTGVRIGVSTVKGLAFGTGKPCIGVSTLLSLGENLMPLDGLYCPCMDARRGQVYNALFENKGGVLTRLTPDRAISLEDLVKEIALQYSGRPVYLSGDGYDIAYTYFKDNGIPLMDTPEARILANGVFIAKCAMRAYEAGVFTTDKELAPTYLRLPQAERDRLNKLKTEKGE